MSGEYFNTASTGDVYYNDVVNPSQIYTYYGYGDWTQEERWLREANKGSVGIGTADCGSKLNIKEEIKMGRALYNLIVVDPKSADVVMNKYIVGDNREDVLLESGIMEVLRSKNLKISEVDKILTFIGPVRKTKKTKDGDIEICDFDKK